MVIKSLLVTNIKKKKFNVKDNDARNDDFREGKQSYI